MNEREYEEWVDQQDPYIQAHNPKKQSRKTEIIVVIVIIAFAIYGFLNS